MTGQGNILDNFVVPQHIVDAGAKEDIAKMNLQFDSPGAGVSVMSGFDRSGIAYRFEWIYEYNHRKSVAAGVELYDKKEGIRFFINRKTEHVCEIKYLDPERLSFNLRGEPSGGAYFEAYKRWIAGEETPGTSLGKWDVIDPGMVKTLASEGIFSVEQFASLPEDKVRGTFPRIFVEAWERAKLHMANRDATIKTQEQAEQLLQLLEQNAKLQEEMTALKAQVEENSVAKVGKPKNKLKKTTNKKTIKGKPKNGTVN